MKMPSFTINRLFLLLVIGCFLPSCRKEPYTTKTTYYKLKQEQRSKNTDATAKLVKPAVAKRKPQALTFAELQEAKEYSTAINNKAQVMIYLELMIKQCSDPNLLKELCLELADLCFEEGKLEQAAKLYASYSTLYPGSPQRAYVHYQAILCKFYSTLNVDRDQTLTEETLKLTQLYLELAHKADPLYKEYSDDIQTIQKQCCTKLVDHEMDVFNFYYKKGNYKAAQIHLDEIKRTYMAIMKSDIEPKILALESNLAEKQGDQATVLAKQAELQSKYPVNSLTLASNTHKTDHVKRF